MVKWREQCQIMAFSFHSQKNITTLGEGGAIYVKKKSEAFEDILVAP